MQRPRRRGLSQKRGHDMTPLANRASLWARWWNGLHSSAGVRDEQSRRGSIAVSRGRALLPTAMNLQTCANTPDQPKTLTLTESHLSMTSAT